MNGILTQAFLYEKQLAPVAELAANGEVLSRIVYGSRPNVPEYMVKGGVAYRLVTDHLGSVRLVVNTSTGQVVERIQELNPELDSQSLQTGQRVKLSP